MIQIGNLDGMIATGTLSEYDTLKVAVGQKVVLSSDAVPGEKWEGEIIKIGTLPTGKYTCQFRRKSSGAISSNDKSYKVVKYL